MSQNSHDCLICLTYAKKRRSQIDNYGCECDYYIHRSCYERWRETSRTDRLCVICDIRERPPIDIIQYNPRAIHLQNIDIQEDNNVRHVGRCREVCEECVLLSLVFVFICLHFIRQFLYLRNFRVHPLF